MIYNFFLRKTCNIHLINDSYKSIIINIIINVHIYIYIYYIYIYVLHVK